ncbi:hypothetical protein QE429_002161 [Bacillus sp. SORGH_AS 510]|uniref:zinc-finger domain-containing protein n=1 Tax=Bacillus sp. SORGH_AS_0510 TaxID=3041771 RepID=UPI002784AEA2|nr:zinc-finger domain-containing protein [Bacillus sp. SORGH_AS_0510]MDQ1145334.1 hypothetical protein [Bacillus sp. SORGH_AS_0510]
MEQVCRRELLSHMENLMIHYCEGCFLHQHIKKENGRRAAHRFCISQCTVGEKLQEYGKKLK